MFTVVMPIYNKAPHLRRSIDSVLDQTFKEFELILINDASTDGSEEILKSYNDYRIKILNRSEPGPGGYAARNLGINTASYGWISFIDADDSWEPTFLESKSKAIRENPHAEFFTTKWDNIYSDRVNENLFFNKFSKLYVDFTLIDFFYENYFVWTSATTAKKDLLIRAGLFPEDRCKRGGDMDAWIRCLELSKGNVWINIKLAHYFKETINQVTSNKSNPVVEICALKTIENIRVRTENPSMHKAMDFFLSNVLYNKIITDYRQGKDPSYNQLKVIRNFWTRISVLLKIFIRITIYERKVS
jgi:glycosyltransferase involved in cell wall biosynthesis